MRLLSLLLIAATASAQYYPYPPAGDPHWKAPVASVAALPLTGNFSGDARVETTAFGIYIWNGSAWVSSAAAGTISGPGSSTDNALVRWDGAAGTVIQNSTALLNDAGFMTTVGITLTAATASTVPVFNSVKGLVSSGVTDTTLGYLDATSSIQTQLNAKQASGNYITALTGDVTAAGPGSAAATVALVGGSSAANVNSATVLALASTSANTPSTIVRRDASGTFAGTMVGNITGTATNITGNLPNAQTTATSSNTPSTIVARDANGNFSATTITSNMVGNITGTATTFTGNLSGALTSSGMVTTQVSEISGMIESPSAKIYVVDQSATFPYTINSLAGQNLSGNVTVTAKINGVAVTGITSQAYTSTVVTATASAANTVVVGDKVTLTPGANPNAADFSFTMKITR